MAQVIEVRPEAIQPDELAGFTRLLERAGPVGQNPRLVGPDGVAMEIPHEIHAVLVSIVEHLRAGDGVTVVPMHAQLTTVEAADLLNVSRPYLIKQIEAGRLAHHMVGTHRRLRLADVLAYRDRMATEAEELLTAMSARPRSWASTAGSGGLVAGYAAVLDANSSTAPR